MDREESHFIFRIGMEVEWGDSWCENKWLSNSSSWCDCESKELIWIHHKLCCINRFIGKCICQMLIIQIFINIGELIYHSSLLRAWELRHSMCLFVYEEWTCVLEQKEEEYTQLNKTGPALFSRNTLITLCCSMATWQAFYSPWGAESNPGLQERGGVSTNCPPVHQAD